MAVNVLLSFFQYPENAKWVEEINTKDRKLRNIISKAVNTHERRYVGSRLALLDSRGRWLLRQMQDNNLYVQRQGSNFREMRGYNVYVKLTDEMNTMYELKFLGDK